MSDIVERLRSLRHIHVPQLSDEAADEIERLRNGAAEGRETVQDGGVVPTVTWFDEKIAEECRIAQAEIERLRADWPEQLKARSVLIVEQEVEIARLRLRLSRMADCPVSDNAAKQDNGKTLTREERDVLREVCRVYADEDDAGCNEIACVIDRLLARLGPAANRTPNRREDCGEYRTGSVDAKVVEGAAECTVKSAKLPERDRLTDAERKALTEASEFYTATRTGLALSGLLARLSPPAT
jgi:hypothetical protein